MKTVPFFKLEEVQAFAQRCNKIEYYVMFTVHSLVRQQLVTAISKITQNLSAGGATTFKAQGVTA